MKKLLGLLLAIIPMSSLNAQMSYGLSMSYSPNRNPRTSGVVVNKSEPLNAMLFNIENSKSNQQIGGVIRLDSKPFWLMGELLIGQMHSNWSIKYYSEPKNAKRYSIIDNYIKMPVSIGVDVGLLDFFSGFSIEKIISTTNALFQIDGYAESNPISTNFHGGLGLRAGQLFLSMRYDQSFHNYGAKKYFRSEELALYNAPGRLFFSVTLFLD